MITVLLNDSGERVTLNAQPNDVSVENSSLIIRRDKQIIGKFRRYVAYWQTSGDTDTHD